MYSFSCDYLEGAHPEVLRALSETNLTQAEGYSCDPWCREAAELIRGLCHMTEPEEKARYGQPDIHFLAGGTQCNATLIAAALRPYQGVLCAEPGHINTHETGAVEATGHKVLPLPSTDGKINAAQVREYHHAHWTATAYDQTVQPGMVYISQPTEFGALYSLDELEQLSAACRELGLWLYMDGARLAYALAAPGNDLTLPDIARLTDAFYLGGTKCGALIGEAMVLPNKELRRDFRYMLRRHCGLLAKGRLIGIQFAALLRDGLYSQLGAAADAQAQRIAAACQEAGLTLHAPVVSNQIFVYTSPAQTERLERDFIFTLWERGESRDLLRFVTSWATTGRAVDELCAVLGELA